MYKIPLTRMLWGAKNSLPLGQKQRSMFVELMIFLLVAMISTMPQNIILSLIQTVMMLSDPEYYALIGKDTLEMADINAYLAEMMANTPSWYYAAALFTSGAMIPTALLYCKLFEKRKTFTLGFFRRGFFGEYILGVIAGAVMISLPVLACVLTGCITLTLAPSFNPIMIAIFFVAFIFQGLGEEALFRGYLMTSLARRHHVWVAIITSSLAFSLFHIGNANFSFIAFINIFLFGVFALVFMLKRGSIWAVGAIHTVWNFAQGNIFGFNVSGNPKFDSIFSAAQENFGAILSGGDFGPEGGLGVTVILLIALLVALTMPAKKCEAIPYDIDEETVSSQA